MYIDARLSQKYFTYEKAQLKNKSKDEEKEAKAVDFRDKLYKIKIEISSKKPEEIKPEDTSAAVGKNVYANRATMAAYVENAMLFNPWSGGMDIDSALEELDGNLAKIGEFSLTKGIGVQKAIEHLASQYSVYKAHIAKNGNAGQQKNLDELIDKHTEKYAKQFSEAIGGFFEKNGMAGEKNRMYTAVKDRVQVLSKSYDNHIQKNQAAFESMTDKTQNEGKSLAFELRIAYMQNGDGELMSRDGSTPYTREELSQAVDLVRLSSELENSGSAANVSEEELGVELGKLVLKGVVFLRTSSAAGEHKEAFMKSVGTHLTQLLDGSDKLLEAERAVDKDDTQLNKPLDRDAVISIIRLMSERYIETGSVKEAVRAGEEYGLRSYLSKADSSKEVKRYQSSPYWANIQRNTEDANSANKNRHYYYKMEMQPIPLSALFDGVRLDYRA